MFQFTHPGRGATEEWMVCNYVKEVSIHAPREGCDLSILLLFTINQCFNSRTPGGVRLSSAFVSDRILLLFQFTHPGRGATPAPTLGAREKKMFQFTHPGRGATGHEGHLHHSEPFQFTHPGRGATSVLLGYAPRYAVSIHAPREGCDNKEGGVTALVNVSIHAPREGCDI